VLGEPVLLLKRRARGRKVGRRKREQGIQGLNLYVYILSPSFFCPASSDSTKAHLQESEYIQKPEVKIVIPDVLKLQLVDDWENVTKNNQASHLHVTG